MYCGALLKLKIRYHVELPPQKISPATQAKTVPAAPGASVVTSADCVVGPVRTRAQVVVYPICVLYRSCISCIVDAYEYFDAWLNGPNVMSIARSSAKHPAVSTLLKDRTNFPFRITRRPLPF